MSLHRGGRRKIRGTRGGIRGPDIRAFIDDIFDFVAIAFQVAAAAPQKGNVADTDKAVNNFLDVCVRTRLAELLTDEINRKHVWQAGLLGAAHHMTLGH